MSAISNTDNKRILKNTLILYIRMFLNMAISLYTSRVVLEVLGVDDYGIYNIVGGVIVLFSFIQNALSSGTQRFINYELGKSENDVRRIFSNSMNVHILIAFILVILFETIGLWFLNEKLNIPSDRVDTANFIYQFSIISACLSIIKTPYNAAVIAYERMSFFAVSSIIESVLRLLVVFLLLIYDGDRLRLYSLLICFVSFFIMLLNILYCSYKLEHIRYRFLLDFVVLKEIFSFSSWSLLVGVSNVASNQGINMIFNIFRGVAVNAAMGIANQVNTAVYSFVSNFQLAYAPQIIKLYASNELSKMYSLIYSTSKLSYYLLFVFVFPLTLSCNFILSIWLVEVPDYAVTFTQLILICSLFDAISAPLWIAIQATGNIKKYQLICSSLLILNLPIAFILMQSGFEPYWALIVKVIINFILFVVRIPFVGKRIGLDILIFLKKVLLPCIYTTFVAVLLPILLSFILEKSFFINLIILLVSFVSCIISIYFFGLTVGEKEFVMVRVNHFIKIKRR